MLKALRALAVPVPIRVLVAPLGDELPAVLTARDSYRLEKDARLSNRYIKDLYATFPTKNSIDRLCATALLFTVGFSSEHVKKALASELLVNGDPFELTRALDAPLSLGIKLASAQCMPMMQHMLARAMWILKDAYARGHTAVHESKMGFNIDALVRSGELVRTHVNGAVFIQCRKMYDTERRIADAIEARIALYTPGLLLPFEADDEGEDMMTPDQREALRMVSNHLFSVVFGSSGTGKTFLAHTLATSIDNCVFVDARTRHIPPDTAVVILDHASMLPMSVYEFALTHAPADAHIVVLGDPDSLLATGESAGFVLRDLLAAHHMIPKTRLEYRHSTTNSIVFVDDESGASGTTCLRYFDSNSTIVTPQGHHCARLNMACQALMHPHMTRTIRSDETLRPGSCVDVSVSSDSRAVHVRYSPFLAADIPLADMYDYIAPEVLSGDRVHDGKLAYAVDVCDVMSTRPLHYRRVIIPESAQWTRRALYTAMSHAEDVVIIGSRTSFEMAWNRVDAQDDRVTCMFRSSFYAGVSFT